MDNENPVFELHEKAVQFLNHLEDVLDEENFNKIDHKLWNAVSMFLVQRSLTPNAMVTYAHRAAPTGTRYRQYAKDPIPVWAVDIKPE